ncbi:MAG TPA: sulfite oxidase [bacterium]|nr:sulfite oxidase [bacterium]
MREDFRDERVYAQARADEWLWARAKAMGVSRRRLFGLLAAGAGAAGAAAAGLGQPARGRTVRAAPATDLVVKPTPPEWFNDFGSNKEMRWEVMYNRGYEVPNELFFVRDHSRTARVDQAAWRLRVEGSGVAHPQEFTYDDILGLPSVSVMRFVECAGNGRSFFEAAYGKRAQGGQWHLGAIGVAEWTGVPLREVLDRCGLQRTARDVMPEGVDELKVRRPMPISKAIADDTLLVYAMNGQILPPDHGFPLRMLVPGWVGVANTKWVGRIEVSDEALFSPWNTDNYILIGPDYDPDPPSKGPRLTSQVVKSAFELVWDGEVSAGRRLLRGRSWSGQGKITKVVVSLNSGKTWQPANLREPNIAQAWVRWDLAWNATPGRYGLIARATDDRGNTQPLKVPFNEQGYLYGGIVSHPVSVT